MDLQRSLRQCCFVFWYSRYVTKRTLFKPHPPHPITGSPLLKVDLLSSARLVFLSYASTSFHESLEEATRFSDHQFVGVYRNMRLVESSHTDIKTREIVGYESTLVYSHATASWVLQFH